ncbi:aldose 1-epimerase family protein [Clostridium sardiniense]|uniref:aldose 1-epimerase family protein n=1 Tax=Clostridium sardiniense TaxID=29369 RepID=UPI00195A192E|nr:aldose 1-epimerase family protein [Clostridium sardiniense]MBM7833917.1 galactose mutarotase-like enzyme [Clostridium sardiniense]
MLYTLENESTKITASTYGGELHNLISKKNEIEFLWNGDPKHWKYHSPILFPIVGKVNNGEYRACGATYNLPQHGLARVSDFEMIDQTKDSITFELKYSNDTLKVYPYKFSLKIKYTLIESGVKVTYIVKNLDDKIIYFSIGAHPAFLCPIEENETMNDYYFEFNHKETADTMLLTKDGYFNHERKDYLDDENIIPLSKELFAGDALVFDNLKSNKISLKSKNHGKSLTMDFEGFPFMGLWSKAEGAPFVCIEPWYGHADYSDFTGELKDKAGIEKLDVNDTFQCSYTLTLSE